MELFVGSRQDGEPLDAVRCGPASIFHAWQCCRYRCLEAQIARFKAGAWQTRGNESEQEGKRVLADRADVSEIHCSCLSPKMAG